MKYLRLFNNYEEYLEYIASEEFVVPSVQVCKLEQEVHFNDTKPEPGPTETRVVCEFNIVDIETETKICNDTSVITKIEIDDIELDTLQTGYTFSSVGLHTVKYTLKNSTLLKDNFFSNCTSIKKVFIPNTITSIQPSLFRNCTNLADVTFYGNINSLGNDCFCIYISYLLIYMNYH